MPITIRLAQISDAPQIQAIYRPIVRDTHFSFEHTVPDTNTIAQRIAHTLRQHPWLVCEIDSAIVGYAYATPFRSRAAYQWTAETTVYVHQRFHRRGISRALYTSLLAILREQGCFQAIGVIALPNPASVRAHESLGFQSIGIFKKVGYKNGAWHDTGWWQLQLRPPIDSPIPPTPIAHLAKQPHFDSLLQCGLPFIKPAPKHPPLT